MLAASFVAVPRPLTPADVPALMAVQRACYGDAFLEPEAVWVRRAAAAHCALVLECDGQLCAYLAAYDSTWGKVTPLHGDFAVAAQPDTVYLHDMAVLPPWAGRGLATALVAHLWAQARKRALTRTALVAVQGAQPYWQRQGYAPLRLADVEPTQQPHLDSYGSDAVYMGRLL